MNAKRRIGFLALIIGLVFSTECSLNAQVAGGTITGIAADTSGAIVPQLTVTIENTATHLLKIVNTSSNGSYQADNLVPGRYKVTASGSGFKTAVYTDITVNVGDTVRLDLQMSVGTFEETVQVTAGAPIVDLSSSTVSQVVNATTVRELPLNGRDWTQLATLQPGVNTALQSPLAITNQRGNRGLGTQMTIGGNRPQQNNYRLDGISINDYSNGGPGSILGIVLGVDAIQEFSVLTSAAPAAYGRSAGGIINAITRSGTNDIHASAYEFIRNSALDARNYYDGPTVPPFRRNQFGATGSAPIKRNRVFIFGDYEGLRQSLTTTAVNIVPSAAARMGHLVAGDVAVSPAVQSFLQLYPLPNGTVSGDSGQNLQNIKQITPANFFTVRADAKLSEKDSIFGTYMFDDGTTSAPDLFNNVINANLSRRQAVIIELTHTFTSSVINSLRGGYSRVASDGPKSVAVINQLASSTQFGFVPGRPPGTIPITGLTTFPGGFGSVGEYIFHYNSYQVYDDAFYNRGAHGFKFGFAFERIQNNQLGQVSPSGTFTFGSLKNFLTNLPTQFSSALSGTVTPRDIRQSIVSAYAQDDWRVTPRLTLNLGLRYEMSTVPTETANRLSNLRSLTATQPTLGSPFFDNPTKGNVEPRVGFVLDPFGRGTTSLRGGVGLFDVLPLPYQTELQTILSAPFFLIGAVVNGTSSPLANTFPNAAYPLLTPNRVRYAYVDPHPPRNYVLQWNLSVQQQLASHLALFLGYIGSRGEHLPYHLEDFNMVLPTKTAAGYVWPSSPGVKLNPTLGQIDGLIWNSTSIYHGLQTQLTREFSHGLQAGLSYTWAKSLDTGSSSLTGDNFPNVTRRLPFDPQSGKGASDFNIAQVLTLNYIWQISALHPGNAFLDKAASGWQLGGIYQFRTGLPFTPIIGGDPLGMQSTQPFDYPDQLALPGCNRAVSPGNPAAYIRTDCFAFPNPRTRLGNVHRNSMFGPNSSNFDVSLFKNTPFSLFGKRELDTQFRVEAFNILNHANFAPPLANHTLFDVNGNRVSNAGLLDSTVTTSRQIQFGIKLTF